MASQKSLDALAMTDKALKEIDLRLRPFLRMLSPSSGIDDPNRLAVARTAVALSLGTLRYMGNRLRGSAQGKDPNDPLRLDLNRMRQILVQVQKKQQQPSPTAGLKRKKPDDASASSEKDAPENVKNKPASKTKRYKS